MQDNTGIFVTNTTICKPTGLSPGQQRSLCKRQDTRAESAGPDIETIIRF